MSRNTAVRLKFPSPLKIIWRGEPSPLSISFSSVEPNKTTANQHVILLFLLYSGLLVLEYLGIEPEEPEEGGGGGRFGLLCE